MRFIYIFILFIVSLGLSTAKAADTLVFSQYVVASAGGEMKSGAYNLSYTIGETVIETAYGSMKSMTQGFQQTTLDKKVYIKPSAGDLSLIGFRFFPNPSSDYLYLEWEFDGAGTLSFELLNMQGVPLLKTKESIASQQANIHISQLKSSTYLLKVTDLRNMRSQVFRIVKI